MVSNINIAKNGYIVDNYYNTIIVTAKQEVYSNSLSNYTIDEKMRLLNSCIVIPVFRLYILDDYENILEDISQDFTNGSLSVTYQSGCRRTLNITLLNGHDKYTPYGNNPYIYMGCKFRLDAGIFIDDTIYWFQQGIFLLQDPTQNASGSEQTVSFNLYDKFALFDGTIFGNSTLKTIVPEGIIMRQAFQNIINADKGNGMPYDTKPIIFNSKYITQETYKTIKQDFNANIGDVLLDCGNTISSDVYYNVYGNLVVENNVNEFLNANFPIILRFNNEDRIIRSKTISYNWSKLRNQIIVKGAITNGYQFSGGAENTNVMSPFYIKGRCGIRGEVITDSNLYSDTLCVEKAMYTLVERQRGVMSLNINTGYIPFVDVNKSVLCNFDDLHLSNQNYVIDSYNMTISQDPSMSFSLTNIGEIIFN